MVPSNSEEAGIRIFSRVGIAVVSAGFGSNGNALAVAPEPFGGFAFRDGFESGDTTSWTSSSP